MLDTGRIARGCGGGHPLNWGEALGVYRIKDKEKEKERESRSFLSLFLSLYIF
jgi:hypothetical protein